MLDSTLSDYIEAVSSSASTPGGGNVAGVVNSLGCGLMLMAIRIAILKKESDSQQALKAEMQIEEVKKRSLFLAYEDSRKFKEVMKNYTKGGEKLQNSLRKSAKVSLDIGEAAVSLLDIISSQNLVKYKNIITDVGIALELARAAYESAIMNYSINISGLNNKDKGLENRKNKIALRFEKRYPVLIKTIKKVID